MSLRIVGGEFKGRRLKSAWDPKRGIRPLAEVFREALFNSLGDAVVGARFGDVFAGTGAVGLEALSRGADAVWFVEKSPKMLRIIRENAAILGVLDRIRVIKGDAISIIPQLPPLDILFLGPPYDKGYVPRIYRSLLSWPHVSESLIILQCSPREWLEDPAFEVIKDLSRGDTVLKIMRRRDGDG